MTLPRIALAAIATAWIGLAATGADAQALGQYCSGPKPDVHVLLIDQTDVYDDIDRRRLFEGAAKILNDLPGGVRLDIYPITDQPGQLTPQLQACVPHCGKGGEKCSDALVLRHRQAFQGAAVEQVSRLGRNARELPQSEILRTLYFLSHEYEGHNLKTVYIFSDMIEFSNLNKTVSKFTRADADRLITAVGSKLPPGKALTQADIRIFGVGKRLGQGVKEARDNEQRQSALEAASTQSRHTGVKPPEPPPSRDYELDTDSLRAMTEFWYRYFDRARAGKVDINLTYR